MNNVICEAMSQVDNKQIAMRLRQVIHILDLTQKEFADANGWERTQLANWMKLDGSHRLSLDGAIKIYESYGIPLEFMYFGRRDTLPANWQKELSSNPRDKNSNTVSE